MKCFLSLALVLCMLLSGAAFTASAESDVTIKVVANANIQSFFDGEDENNNYMIRWIEEQVGFDVEWYILPSENGEAKLNAMMASAADAPDIIALNRDNFLNYYNDEMIQCLDEYITEDFFQYDTQGAYKLGILDGSYWAVSTPGNQSATTYTWWYNTAMLADAGIEVPGRELTLEQFTDILYAIKEAYPDKIPMGAAGDGSTNWLNGFQIIYGAFGIANDYRINENGELEYALGSDDMKECLEYLNKLYADGIIDPEYLVTTKETLCPKMVNGDVVSVCAAWYDFTGTYRKAIENVDSSAKKDSYNWECVNIIDGGKITKGQTTGTLNQWYMCVTYACEHPAEAAQLLKLMLTPEYYDMCFFGVEGVDYHYDENGLLWRNPETTIGKKFAESGTQWYVYYYFSETKDQRMGRLAAGMPDYDMEHIMDVWYDCKEVDNPIAAMPAIEEYIEDYADIKDVASAYHIKFVMGEMGFDKWQDFLNETQAVGGDEVLAALQEWYATL